jgi:hypothetical protein
MWPESVHDMILYDKKLASGESYVARSSLLCFVIDTVSRFEVFKSNDILFVTCAEYNGYTWVAI